MRKLVITLCIFFISILSLFAQANEKPVESIIIEYVNKNLFKKKLFRKVKKADMLFVSDWSVLKKEIKNSTFCIRGSHNKSLKISNDHNFFRRKINNRLQSVTQEANSFNLRIDTVNNCPSNILTIRMSKNNSGFVNSNVFAFGGLFIVLFYINNQRVVCYSIVEDGHAQ